MKESALEAKVVRWCREQGILTYKFSSPARRGVPDRIFIRNGTVIFLELKAPGNKPTALQEHELAILNRAGVVAMWCSDFDKIKYILTSLLLSALV